MNGDSRIKKSLLNARVNLICYFVALIVAFFSRKVFFDFLGAEFLVEPLAVYAIRTAEIRDTGFRGHSCAAEKDGAFAVFQDVAKFLDAAHAVNLFHSLHLTAHKQ